MDIERLRTLYRVDASSPSGVVFNGDRKGGPAKDGMPALTSPKANGSGVLYYSGTFTDCSGTRKKVINFLAHRVVFALVYGYWPETVDHEDGNSLNNTAGNLRAATNSQQQANKGMRKDNTSGVKGVRYLPWKNNTNPWQATCQGKYLGMFRTCEAADAAYRAAAVAAYGAFIRHAS